MIFRFGTEQSCGLAWYLQLLGNVDGNVLFMPVGRLLFAEYLFEDEYILACVLGLLQGYNNPRTRKRDCRENRRDGERWISDVDDDLEDLRTRAPKMLRHVCAHVLVKY